MPDTPNLGLPLLAAAQAQKHVTHNEALLALDALLGCAVLDRDLAAPPASPPDGARYIVAPAPTGAWAGHAGELAERRDGGWVFHQPKAGLLAYLADEGRLLVHDGTAWVGAGSRLGAAQGLALLGLGTSADAANPFSAKLNKALWTARTVAEGGDGDLRYTLNKEGAADVVSLLLQTGFSGRCEIGLVGDDVLSVKVSADGATWTKPLEIAGAAVAPGVDGAVTLGRPGARWSTIHAASGTISTSDARTKTPVAPLGPAELAAARDLVGLVGTYRVLDAVALKGDGARLHVGLTVQAATAALAARGLDPLAYGFVCRDRWEGEGGRPAGDLYAFRADELLFLIVRGLAERLDELERRLAALEPA